MNLKRFNSSSMVIAGLLGVGILFVSSITAPAGAALDATNVPEFPIFGDCHEYVPVGKRTNGSSLIEPLTYMECTTKEGVKVSISE